MKKILLFLALWVSATAAARTSHTLELCGGSAAQPYSWEGESGIARSLSYGGASTLLRYTCFFDEHWGAYASTGVVSINASDAEFFGTVNKADGGRFLYRFDYGCCRTFDMPFTLTAGAAYRLEAGAFTFVQRVGLGVASIDVPDYGIERRSRDGSTGPEYFDYRIVTERHVADYLIDGGETYETPSAFILSADLQIAFKADRRLYLFVQPGLVWAPGRFDSEYDYTGSVKRYEPSNWVEAVAYADAADLWKRNDASKATSAYKQGFAPVFKFEFGIGINLGHVKNSRR